MSAATKYKIDGKNGSASFNTTTGDVVKYQWNARKMSVTVKSDVPLDAERNILDLSDKEGTVGGKLEGCVFSFDTLVWSGTINWSGKVTVNKKKGYKSWAVKSSGR